MDFSIALSPSSNDELLKSSELSLINFCILVVQNGTE